MYLAQAKVTILLQMTNILMIKMMFTMKISGCKKSDAPLRGASLFL
jgi:hypothetical protein